MSLGPFIEMIPQKVEFAVFHLIGYVRHTTIHLPPPPTTTPNLSSFEPWFLPGIYLTAPWASIGGYRTFIEMILSLKI